MSERTLEDIMEALAVPFAADEVKWKPAMVKGDRALALCYIDARCVMDRLDEVFGLGGWQTSYRECKDGVVCTLRVKVGDDWITHEDVGGESEQPDEGDRQKAAFSDSLKRAAVHLGIGRYLYRLSSQWCDYDTQKRHFAKTPTLPAWALPKGAKAAPVKAPAAIKNPALPADGKELKARLEAYERKLVADGVCGRGALVKEIAELGVKEHGLSPNIEEWGAVGIRFATDHIKGGQEAKARAAQEAKAS